MRTSLLFILVCALVAWLPVKVQASEAHTAVSLPTLTAANVGNTKPGPRRSYGLPCVSPKTGLDVCALEPGDILFAHRPLDLLNQIIAFLGQTYWYHTAIYVGDGYMVEAHNLMATPAEQVALVWIYDGPWWSGHKLLDWVVVRPLADGGLRARAAAYAQAIANQIEPPILFNVGFFARDREDAFYCSQLVWKAYLGLGIDLETDRGSPANIRGFFITPDELVDSVNAGLAEIAQAQPQR